MVDIAKLARTVDTAAHKAKAIPQLSEKAKYSLDDAYAIQSASIQRRLDRGEKRNGMKMGFTSRAKMIQMGLNDMIWGRLTDQMMIEDGGTISLKNYVHPRVEPEIAFLLKRPLGYPCTAAEALAAVDGVAPAMGNHRFPLPELQVLARRRGRGQCIVLQFRRRPVASPGYRY